MNHSYSVFELCQLLKGHASQMAEQQVFNHFSIDSRNIQHGDLFFALLGEKTDGHLYIQQALDKGATGIIANPQRLASKWAHSSLPLIAVADPNRALMELAQDYRERFTEGQVLGITGSNGKTSTKEIAAQICHFLGAKTHATERSFNNYIGVPLTLLSATLKEAWWVVEMGTNHFGEIATLSKMVKPNWGLITNIGESHLEFLENTEGVAREKSGLFAGMSSDSIAVIPANLLHQEIVQDFASHAQVQLVTYGFDHWNLDSDYTATLQSFSPNQAQFEWLGHQFETLTGNPLLLSNLLGILTILHLSGVPLASLVLATQQLAYTIQGRMQFRKTPTFLLVDDTYNANPTSFHSAINTLKAMYPQRRLIIVAGEMAELGKHSPDFHCRVGQQMHQSGVAHVLAFGKNEAPYYIKGWKKAGGLVDAMFWTDDLEALKEAFQAIVQKEDIVLVKGSRVAQMERFVQAVI